MKSLGRRSRVLRIYRALLYAFPSHFRQRFGGQMTDYLRDRWNDELRDANAWQSLRFCVRAWLDLLAAALTERTARGFSLRNSPSSSGDSMLQTLLQDLRFSGRMLRKNPVLAAVAITVIALGTGAVSTVFSVANAIGLRDRTSGV